MLTAPATGEPPLSPISFSASTILSCTDGTCADGTACTAATFDGSCDHHEGCEGGRCTVNGFRSAAGAICWASRLGSCDDENECVDGFCVSGSVVSATPCQKYDPVWGLAEQNVPEEEAGVSIKEEAGLFCQDASECVDGVCLDGNFCHCADNSTCVNTRCSDGTHCGSLPVDSCSDGSMCIEGRCTDGEVCVDTKGVEAR
jgi:hypothetical protein